jgi:hypothetical protein
MLIKLTQSFFYVPSTTMIRGSVIEIADAIATDWIRAELAVPVSPKAEAAVLPHYAKAVSLRHKAKGKS